ncbi:MAG: chromate transporter [Chitinophagales bacterium]
MGRCTKTQLFRAFLIIGTVSFGGGYAMIPLIRREMVERTGWLTDDRFLDALAIAQSSPGPMAVNLSIIVGHQLLGAGGAFAATAGAVLPSVLSILLIAVFFTNLEYVPAVGRFFAGVRPAMLALIALAAWDLGVAAVKNRESLLFLALALAALILLRLHPALVMLAGLLYGLALRRDREVEKR